jgi:dTDP-4-amino-4,6-dideoxy-D-galactose acyltransferase
MNEPCVFLDWDTKFFGRRIGRIHSSTLDPASLAAIMAWRAEHQVECLYFLADPDAADSAATIRLAETSGFRLQDVRVMYELKRPAEPPVFEDVVVLDNRIRLREAKEADLPYLLGTARRAYFHSRFYNDPHFDDERCDEMYATWLTKSIGAPSDLADMTFVAELADVPTGYMTCKVDRTNQIGTMRLLGVLEAARGNSLGEKLVAHTLRWLWSQGVQKIQVATQGRNITAQRLYQRIGFLSQRMDLWYHWWHDEQRGL